MKISTQDHSMQVGLKRNIWLFKIAELKGEREQVRHETNPYDRKYKLISSVYPLLPAFP